MFTRLFLHFVFLFSLSLPLLAQSTNTASTESPVKNSRTRGFDEADLSKSFTLDGKKILYEQDDKLYAELIKNDKAAMKLFQTYQADKFWGGFMMVSGGVIGVGGLVGFAYLQAVPQANLFWQVFGVSAGLAVAGVSLMFGGVAVQKQAPNHYTQSVKSLDQPIKVSLNLSPYGGQFSAQIRF
jgi:hypothetical protein